MRFQTNQTIATEKRARVLRNASTDAERTLWQKLRSKQVGGARFRRQHPVGNFIADFLSFDAKLVVELDGGQHSEQQDYDERRTAYLESCGFKVLRFWNHEVLNETDTVLERIHSEVVLRFTPIPLPASPLKGEEQNLAHSETLATSSPPLQGEGQGGDGVEHIPMKQYRI